MCRRYQYYAIGRQGQKPAVMIDWFSVVMEMTNSGERVWNTLYKRNLAIDLPLRCKRKKEQTQSHFGMCVTFTKIKLYSLKTM